MGGTKLFCIVEAFLSVGRQLGLRFLSDRRRSKHLLSYLRSRYWYIIPGIGIRSFHDRLPLHMLLPVAGRAAKTVIELLVGGFASTLLVNTFIFIFHVLRLTKLLMLV